MRIITLALILSLFSSNIQAQAPNKMSFQAVIRDADENLISNQLVSLRISILNSSASNNVVYAETHEATANLNGLVSLVIGEGTPIRGDINNIDWSSGPHYIRTETDVEGGTNYNISATNELLSVPYAMYAGSAGNAGSGSGGGTSIWQSNNNDIYYNTGAVGIGTNRPGNILEIQGNEARGNRTFLQIDNQNNSSTASVAMNLAVGNSANYTTLRMHGDNYSYSWYGTHGQLKTLGNGLIIEATKHDNSGGDLVFVNGSTNGSDKIINMMLNSEGNLGVGTDRPREKVQIRNGDIYMEDINSGVILRSSNGQCWRLTINNDGSTATQSVTCP